MILDVSAISWVNIVGRIGSGKTVGCLVDWRCFEQKSYLAGSVEGKRGRRGRALGGNITGPQLQYLKDTCRRLRFSKWLSVRPHRVRTDMCAHIWELPGPRPLCRVGDIISKPLV